MCEECKECVRGAVRDVCEGCSEEGIVRVMRGVCVTCSFIYMSSGAETRVALTRPSS